MFYVIKNFINSYRSSYISNISYIILGIGNPGEKYIGTRHNIGFDVIDALSHRYTVLTSGKWDCSEIKVCKCFTNINVVLAKPMTYVNRSGTALNKLLKRYRLQVDSCLIIVDDFNLSLGKIRFRPGGSDGGHKGLKSIISAVGKDFPRLRIGIGPKSEKTNTVEFVLSRFRENEINKMNNMVEKAVESITFFCKEGITAAMNNYN